jgi:hypothetical protein
MFGQGKTASLGVRKELNVTIALPIGHCIVLQHLTLPLTTPVPMRVWKRFVVTAVRRRYCLEEIVL